MSTRRIGSVRTNWLVEPRRSLCQFVDKSLVQEIEKISIILLYIKHVNKKKKKRELIAFDNSEFFIHEQNRLFEYLVDVPWLINSGKISFTDARSTIAKYISVVNSYIDVPTFQRCLVVPTGKDK